MSIIRKLVTMTMTPLLLSLLMLTCKDAGTEPPRAPERVKLTLIDVAVKEAYLHVAVTSPASNEMLALQRNGTTVMTLAAVADTNIADTALTQTTAYQYTARLTANTETTGIGNTISAQTLAPTSHNFTWQTFFLGDGNNSTLSDVAIINDTLIYAVGELYLRDSTGAIGDTPYNLAKWNGQRWEIKRVTVLYRGNLVTAPLYGIFAFSANDIWLTAGVPIHGDGQSWTQYHLFDMGVLTSNDGSLNKIWGGSTGVYFVGNRGTMAYYSSGRWQRLESGTTTRINDAWGVVNPVTGKEEVYCAASSFFGGGEKKILRITDIARVDSVRWVDRLIDAVWTNAGYPLFTAGDGVFDNKSGQWREVNTGIFTNKIRGTGLNNIIAVGDFGFMTHYNGADWQTVGYDPAAGYGSVTLNTNLVVAVGRKNAQAIATIGRR